MISKCSPADRALDKITRIMPIIYLAPASDFSAGKRADYLFCVVWLGRRFGRKGAPIGGYLKSIWKKPR